MPLLVARHRLLEQRKISVAGACGVYLDPRSAMNCTTWLPRVQPRLGARAQRQCGLGRLDVIGQYDDAARLLLWPRCTRASPTPTPVLNCGCPSTVTAGRRARRTAPSPHYVTDLALPATDAVNTTPLSAAV